MPIVLALLDKIYPETTVLCFAYTMEPFPVLAFK